MWQASRYLWLLWLFWLFLIIYAFDSQSHIHTRTRKRTRARTFTFTLALTLTRYSIDSLWPSSCMKMMTPDGLRDETCIVWPEPSKNNTFRSEPRLVGLWWRDGRSVSVVLSQVFCCWWCCCCCGCWCCCCRCCCSWERFCLCSSFWFCILRPRVSMLSAKLTANAFLDLGSWAKILGLEYFWQPLKDVISALTVWCFNCVLPLAGRPFFNSASAENRRRLYAFVGRLMSSKRWLSALLSLFESNDFFDPEFPEENR